MDKIYSKSAMIGKAVYCCMITPICILLSSFLNVVNPLLYVIIALIPIGCLYTVPFWISTAYIKKYRVGKIGKYVIYDLISCFVPAFFGILFFEIIYTIIVENIIASGLLTIIFSIIFIIVSALFWIAYLIFSKRK